MWMLDVFCCALGCMILLLLLKMREAGIISEESANLSSELADVKLALADSESKNRTLGAEIDDRDGKLALLAKEQDDASHRLALVLKERDEAARNLALVRSERDVLAKKLAVTEQEVKTAEANLAAARQKIEEAAKLLALTRERSTKSEEELAKKSADITVLAKKMADAEKNRDELQQLLRDKEKQRADALKQALDLSDRLLAAETKLKNSEKRVDDLAAQTAEMARLRTKLQDLEKRVDDANVTIVDLQGTKAKLADKINKMQIESEQRFAGIAMTGTNVVFLVDMSGSMDRTDENTIDPNKWPIVRDTLIKAMRSIPNLTQFQVMVFSSKYSYLIGSEGDWLKYEGEKSIDQVRKAMTAVKPVGDTNLFAAFAEAFKFRGKGLDTIYLLSDGLPTSGPGLTDIEERTLTSETARGAILARYLRKTLAVVWNAPSEKRPRVRINSIGFFYESPDVGAFLWALSRENDGSFVGMSRP
jgi:hypothetical protein